VGIGRTLRVPGRGFRRVVVVLVVLMLAGATGGAIALTAPSVLDLVRNRTPSSVTPPLPARLLGALPAGAPTPTASGIAAVLDTKVKALPGTFAGVVLDPATGKPLWQKDPTTGLATGSTVKLVTSAAALLSLDPTSSLVTRAVTGAEPGTVVLVGGGDPTLTALPAPQVGTYPSPARLTDLAAAVKKAMPDVRRVLIDTSRYRGPAMADGWVDSDITNGDITPIGALMLDGGRIDPAEPDGARVTDPAAQAGAAFAKLLGLPASAASEGTAAPSGKEIAAVTSAPVSDLVEHLLQASDNVTAEVMARETALARDLPPTFEGGVQATTAALQGAGIDTAGVTLADGSGLSANDRVTPALLGALLAAAAAPSQGPDDVEFLRPILAGLPVAGGVGTLDDRFGSGDPSEPGRGVVRAKTGTLTSANSLAGVVTDADGRLLVFAFVSNGVLPSRIRPKLDALAAGLAACGCR
jgi:serine-type D-Ala-D-Ala carboxypeptidase/endopeptidase (penicillin-binding protein 4)